MEDREEKKKQRKPEETVKRDEFLERAIREANCIAITWKQDDINFLIELFD